MTFRTLQRYETPSGAAFHTRGSGSRTIVLIHGVGMRIEAWGPQIDRLSRDCRVIALDLPGHGESAALAGDPGLKDYVAWLLVALKELDLGPVHIAGHSMGALIAGGAAVEAPDLVRGVALLNCVYRRSPSARAAVVARAREMANGSFEHETPLTRWFSPEERGSAPFNLVREILQQVDPAGYSAAYLAFACGDATYADDLVRVMGPALVLTGELDPNSTPEMTLALARVLPAASARILPGHRHMVNLTAPEQVNRLLLSWLAAGHLPAMATPSSI